MNRARALPARHTRQSPGGRTLVRGGSLRRANLTQAESDAAVAEGKTDCETADCSEDKGDPNYPQSALNDTPLKPAPGS